jgi:predicted methyltransferase
VISIEKDLNVLQLASANPWSKMLENPRIKIVVGDAYNLVEDLCSECFEKIFHDPPRISIAEELYSSEFYRELYRILRSNGKLFHYTGEPGKHSNISYLKGIKRRLEEAGFYKVLWINDAKGFIAFKP